MNIVNRAIAIRQTENDSMFPSSGIVEKHETKEKSRKLTNRGTAVLVDMKNHLRRWQKAR